MLNAGKLAEPRFSQFLELLELCNKCQPSGFFCFYRIRIK